LAAAEEMGLLGRGDAAGGGEFMISGGVGDWHESKGITVGEEEWAE
jgi:hypothetical protein